MENNIAPFKSSSKIEKMIRDESFVYNRPWFYNHPYALRCELGVDDSKISYMKNTKKRAFEIFDLIFASPPDAIFFDHYVEDYSELKENNPNSTLRSLKKELKFLSSHLKKYESIIVSDITCDEVESGNYIQKNRIISYTDKKYPYRKRVVENFSWERKTVHFVSFQNECILSIYDDRGCDIVFATKEKMQEFYHKLNSYLLQYDIEEMEKRLAK